MINLYKNYNFYVKMETNFSKYDKLEMKDLWKVGASLLLAGALLYGGWKAMSNYQPKQNIDARQISNLEILSECEGGMK